MHSFLAQMLKVKENFLSDRDLTNKLLSNSIYRFCCGFKHKTEIPAHNTYTYLRKRLGVWGYIEIHTNFVNQAYNLGILEPDVPVLPKNRRPGLLLIPVSSMPIVLNQVSEMRTITSSLKIHQLVLLFLDSCGVTKWLKAASILDRYLKNAKKVVPQNIHLFLDL